MLLPDGQDTKAKAKEVQQTIHQQDQTDPQADQALLPAYGPGTDPLPAYREELNVVDDGFGALPEDSLGGDSSTSSSAVPYDASSSSRIADGTPLSTPSEPSADFPSDSVPLVVTRQGVGLDADYANHKLPTTLQIRPRGDFDMEAIATVRVLS